MARNWNQQGTEFYCPEVPMNFEALTKIKGPVNRHLEQLWDEIQSLKDRVRELEKKI